MTILKQTEPETVFTLSDGDLDVSTGDLVTVTDSGNFFKEDFLVKELNGDIVTVTRMSEKPSEVFSSDIVVKLPPDQNRGQNEQMLKPEPLKRSNAPWRFTE